MKLGVLHPGAMGVTVGMAALSAGHSVYWVPQGRSPQTLTRAEAAGFEACADLTELTGVVDGILSVCPPDAAIAVARAELSEIFDGIYVDANAVTPSTTREFNELVDAGSGARFVDGGIIGPPATRPGTTRLYLSGDGAAEVAGWFAGSALSAQVIDGRPGAASALKMCYAAYTKGASALLLAVRALADAEGVTPALLAEWEASQPGLASRSESTARGTAPKAWRFVGEMIEIASSFEAHDLPGGFHRAAAEIYGRIGPLKGEAEPTLADVLLLLKAEGPEEGEE